MSPEELQFMAREFEMDALNKSAEGFMQVWIRVWLDDFCDNSSRKQ
jgi:hypothetical protein